MAAKVAKPFVLSMVLSRGNTILPVLPKKAPIVMLLACNNAGSKATLNSKPPRFVIAETSTVVEKISDVFTSCDAGLINTGTCEKPLSPIVNPINKNSNFFFILQNFRLLFIFK